MCSIEDVADWGPFIHNAARCEHLSFTLFFEEALMSILPSACALSLAVYRICIVSRRETKVKGTLMGNIKLGCNSVFSILALAQLCVYALHDTPKTRLSLASSIILFLTSLAFIPLSALEHTRSLRPCTILEIYYTLSFLLGIIQCKTLWMIQDSQDIAGIVTAMLVVRFIALLAESQGKRQLLLAPHRHVPPDGTGGVFNTLTLSWLLPLLKRGYSSSLALETLFQIEKEMRPKALLVNISARWSKATQTRSSVLLLMMLSQQRYTVLAGAFYRLCLVGLRFAQPFLVQAELDFSDDRESASAARGNWLIVGYAGVYLGIVVCRAGFQYHTRRFIVQVRGSLVPLLYRHMLRADPMKTPQSVPVSLVSVDMEKIALGLITIHDIWGSLIEIGLFIWMIERQIHLAVLASALASLGCLCCGFFISTRAMGHLKAWLEDTQKRIHITESVLTQYKSVALAGFMDAVMSRISALRKTEIQTSKGYRTMVVGVLTMAYSSTVMAPVIGFGLFVFVPGIRGSATFTSQVAFSSLTAFTLFTASVTSFVQSTFEIISALTGFERYREYLLEPELIDPRSPLPGSQLLPARTSESSLVEGDDDEENIALQMFISNLPLRTQGRTCLILQDADIGWPKNLNVVQGVSMSLRSRTVTAISGGPGSGKTTLLDSFLGQAIVSKGTLSTSFSTAAYCSQQPWIYEGTIKENIVNCCALSLEWYETVLSACALLSEVSRMPLKDDTPAGSGGSCLSGGQRKRVALARAVYSRLDVLILDDVLSGLDPETSKTVWRNLCGVEGLLRREGRTVIFSSVHNAGLSLADNIFDIKDGKLSKRPPPRDSMLSVRSTLDLSRVTLDTTYVPDLSFGFNRLGRVGTLREVQDVEFNHMDEEPEVDKTSRKKKKMGDWQAYNYYISAIGRRDTLILLFITLGLVLGLQLPQIWIALWAKANEDHNGLGNATYYGVFVALGGSALLFLVVGGSYFMLKMVPRSAHVLHRALLETTLKASIVYINSQSIGSVINRFSQDLAIVDTEVPISGFNTIFYALACIVQAVVISVSSKYMAAAMAVFLILFYLLQSFYLKTSRQLRVLDIEAKAPLISHVSGTIAGLKTIQSGGWTAQSEANALAILDNSQRPFYLLYCVQVWLGLMLDLLVAIVAVTLVSVTNSLHGSSTAGFLGVALTSIVNFGVNLNELMVSWTYIETALQAILRIRSYARDTPVEESIDAGDFNPAVRWPQNGRIEFRNVCASYGKHAGLVLNNLSFLVKEGTSVGICGRSGSGKSSLLATLYRLLEVESGSILIDGVDIRQVPLRTLRDNLFNVPQDAFLIPGTLRYNMDPSGVKTDAELTVALEAVGLWDLLQKDGLDTDVSQYIFSSGHKQSLSLARALVRDGNIVTVDELTSNLDADGASVMRDTLRARFSSHTILMVSHRLEDLLACDQVLVLEDGHFVEFGDASALWGDENSKFRKMFT